MHKKITVNCLKNKIFWVNKTDDILNLRNQCRIIGNLIRISKNNFKTDFFLFLSIEEIILGLELGFLKPKILSGKNSNLLGFLLKKINFFFFWEKNICNKKNQISLKKKKRNYAIKKWRETSEIISKVCLFSFDRKKNSIKNQFHSERTRIFYQEKRKYPKVTIYLREFLNNFTQNDFLKYSVLKSLWQKGFTLSCGIKFGCSFLAYAGNITDVHSYLSILLVPMHYSNISPKLVVSFGRIGTITKKFNIFANLDKFCCVKYTALRWHNNLP